MNVNKPCTACKKTVYPMEQLKCLDQYWHKGCFKCEVCKTTLNMKNYKGFEKKPYCHAHYPTVKHTPVSDTPELKRALANSQKVSQVKYHEQFEKAKGQKISVTDDPLSSLQKKTQQNISQVVYHNLKDKRQTMEARRSSIDAVAERHHEAEANGAGAGVGTSVDMRRMSTGSSGSSHSVGDRANFYTRAALVPPAEAGTVQVTQQAPRFKPGRIEDYDPLNEEYGSVARMSASSDHRGQRPSSFQGDVSEETMPAPMPQRSPIHQSAPRGPYSPPAPVLEDEGTFEPEQQEEPVFEPEPSPPVKEDVGNLTPVAEATEFEPQPPAEVEEEPQVSPKEEAPASNMGEQYGGDVQPENGRASMTLQWPEGVEYGKAPLYRAAYEYESQDTDEVSFVEGDIISNGIPIDEGWMYGLVERTGAYGMMPSNYVTPL